MHSLCRLDTLIVLLSLNYNNNLPYKAYIFASHSHCKSLEHKWWKQLNLPNKRIRLGKFSKLCILSHYKFHQHTAMELLHLI